MSSRRSTSVLAHAFTVCLIAGFLARPAAAQTLTIPLNLALDNLVTVNATLSVDAAAIQGGQLVISATASGSVTLNGTTAVIAVQPFTLTAATTCKAGTGTVTLTTSALDATLPGGVTATVAAETVTVSASCGRLPTLALTASPISATLSDGTSLSTSAISASLSAPPNTALGSAICAAQNVICTLNTDIAGGLIANAVGVLSQLLASLPTTLL
jgi:hypothetical protein